MVAPLIQLTNRLARASLERGGFQSRLVSTAVGRVHVLDAEGAGHLPPIVLLHGISSEAVHFFPLFHRLRPRVRRIVAPDLPAHGLSDAPHVVAPEPLRQAMIDALDQVIDEPAILFGNSMGGMAAVQYALARPERVRGLVLASPSGAMMPEADLRRFLAGFALRSHEDALSFVDRLFARRNRLRQVFAWGVRHQFETPAIKALLAATSPRHLLTPEALGTLRAPTLLLWGRQERILPRSHLAYFRRHLPEHARFDEPDGFGHAPYLDDPDGVARRILAFAAEVQERAPVMRPRRQAA